MGCWVRTAAAAQRSGPRPTGAGRHPGPGSPGRPGTVPGGSACRQVQAAPATGTLPRPADAGRAPSSAPDAGGGPGAPLLAAAGGLVARPRVPRLRPARRSPSLGPAALALAVRGQRFRSGAVARPGVRAGLLRAAAVLDRHLRRPVPVAGPRGLGGAAPRAARRRHGADLPAARSGRSGRRRCGWPTRRCAAASSLGGFPWGRLGFSQTEGPLLSLAAYGGVPLVSFAVALTGALLAAAVPRAAPGPGAPADAAERGPALRAGAAGRGRRPRRPAGRRPGLAPLPGPSLTAGGPTSHRRGDPGQRAARRAWTSTPSAAPCSTTTSQRTLELAAAVAAAGDAAAARPGHLAGEQLRHRPVPQRRRRRARSTAPPGRSARRSWSARSSRGRAATSATPAIVWDPGDRAGRHLRQAAPGAAGRVRARPVVLPVLQRRASTWSDRLRARRPRSASSTSAAPGWATSSASRWSTTGWCATSSTAAPG